MKREIKIPTLLGLGILIIGLSLGIFLTTRQQTFRSQASSSFEPKNIQITNLSDTSVSILWQTAEKVSGFIRAGTSPSLGLTFQDERDSQAPQAHNLHFVTLNNLSPDTTYYFKINSGSWVYPQKEPSTFKTAQKINPAGFAPLVGKILQSQTTSVKESFITLNIKGAQKLSTITRSAGNFILPLNILKEEDLKNPWTKEEIPAELVITDGKITSIITFYFPWKDDVLPQIILGENQNLILPEASASGALKMYDLNNDGVINSLDLSEVLKQVGKPAKNNPADLNNDGKIDQEDVVIISKFIPNISPE